MMILTESFIPFVRLSLEFECIPVSGVNTARKCVYFSRVEYVVNDRFIPLKTTKCRRRRTNEIQRVPKEKNATATRAKKTRPRESPISAQCADIQWINSSSQSSRTVHKTHIAYIIHAVARDNQVKLNAFLNTSTKWSDFLGFCFQNNIYLYQFLVWRASVIASNSCMNWKRYIRIEWCVTRLTALKLWSQTDWVSKNENVERTKWRKTTRRSSKIDCILVCRGQRRMRNNCIDIWQHGHFNRTIIGSVQHISVFFRVIDSKIDWFNCLNVIFALRNTRLYSIQKIGSTNWDINSLAAQSVIQLTPHNVGDAVLALSLRTRKCNDTINGMCNFSFLSHRINTHISTKFAYRTHIIFKINPFNSVNSSKSFETAFANRLRFFFVISTVRTYERANTIFNVVVNKRLINLKSTNYLRVFSEWYKKLYW